MNYIYFSFSLKLVNQNKYTHYWFQIFILYKFTIIYPQLDSSVKINGNTINLFFLPPAIFPLLNHILLLLPLHLPGDHWAITHHRELHLNMNICLCFAWHHWHTTLHTFIHFSIYKHHVHAFDLVSNLLHKSHHLAGLIFQTHRYVHCKMILYILFHLRTCTHLLQTCFRT